MLLKTVSILTNKAPKKISHYYRQFQDVLQEEGQAILTARNTVRPEDVSKLITLYQNLASSGGDLVVCGLGKSGQIANKMVSTFNSTGLKSFFLHPVEALHGDLGRVKSIDAIVLISKSGTTEEILKLIPHLPTPSKNIIGLLGNPSSPIGEKCHLIFNCAVNREACINNQAPTTSSTLTLAMGDAMTVIWETFSDLSQERFALNHPAGFLGKSLRMKVSHLMIPAHQCPCLPPDTPLKEAIIKMTELPVGMCALVKNDIFYGLLVEGDIRRTLIKNLPLSTPIKALALPSPIFVTENTLAIKALELMEFGKRILNILPVLQDDKFVGILRSHELLREGFSTRSR